MIYGHAKLDFLMRLFKISINGIKIFVTMLRIVTNPMWDLIYNFSSIQNI